MQSILSEFNDLKAAVERHIAKMKCFASDLERSSQKLDSFGGTTNVIRYVSKVSTKAATIPKEVCIVSPGMKTQHSELTYIGPSTSNSQWSQQFDDIEVVNTFFTVSIQSDHNLRLFLSYVNFFFFFLKSAQKYLNRV